MLAIVDDSTCVPVGSFYFPGLDADHRRGFCRRLLSLSCVHQRYLPWGEKNALTPCFKVNLTHYTYLELRLA